MPLTLPLPMVWALALTLLLPGLLPAIPSATWSFEPDEDNFSDNSLLDLRHLNESQAGIHGFVHIRSDGVLALGDRTPARFWAVNTYVGRDAKEHERPLWKRDQPHDLARHARFLAKRGVNVVRLHTALNPRLADDAKHPALDEAHAPEIDWIQQVVAAMKKEGIYTVISPYWANTMKSDDAAWGTEWKEKHHGLLFFDPVLQSAYRSWWRQLLEPVNPHTGIPLARDSAVAFLQLQNEDSLLFWTFNNLTGASRTRLGRHFHDWAAAKHGSSEAALRTWNGLATPDDRPQDGILGFFNLWELTGAARLRGIGNSSRHADQAAFLAHQMMEFNRSTTAFLRDELGCRHLINAGNWKTADSVLLEDLERYVYSSADITATNRYFGGRHEGEHNGWAIVNGDTYDNISVFRHAATDFPLNLKQTPGHPMMVTESSWVLPNQYAAEAPFLIAAYSSLNHISGFFWFATGVEQWSQPRSANGYLPSQQKWTFATPDLLGQFPASALMFRRALLRAAEPVLVEHRSTDALYRRDIPQIAESPSFDPNRDAPDAPRTSAIVPTTDPLTFFVGPVHTRFHSDGPAPDHLIQDISSHISDDRREITSLTGEIKLRTGDDDGHALIDSPAAQGVAGFLSSRPAFYTRDMVIRSGNTYATLLAVSMDDLPLARSRRIFVQAGTQSTPTGWKTEPAEDGRLRVVSFGGPPWQIIRPDISVELRNQTVTTATVLDMNGMPTGTVNLHPTANGIRFQFPEQAMYLLLHTP